MLDVDFGFLGDGGGHRGNFGSLGWGDLAATSVPATAPATTAPSAPTKIPFDPLKYIEAAGRIVQAFKPPKAGAQVTVLQKDIPTAGGQMPVWALPAAGLAVAGGLAYFLFMPKRKTR